MMASRKIKPPKAVYESRARKPQETDAKRVVDVSGMTQVGGWDATQFVSLPREPWDGDVLECP